MLLHQDTATFDIVLYEGDGAAPLDESLRFDLLAALLDGGYPVTRVTATRGATRSASTTAAAAAESLVVLGDFRGGPPSLIDAEGRAEIATRDIAGLAADAVVALVDDLRGARRMNRPPRAAATTSDPSWKPWFPVIDYDRCTNCLQCLSFCLFDVYGLDDENRIEVRNNDNCKTNCPACSRVCPEVAIMFPKYTGGPINGEEVRPEDVQQEKMKVDISSLLGGDIYSRLRERSATAKSRFSKERSADKALDERKKCLVKLQQDGFIPQEVLESIDLASLPSPDEIRQRAAEMAARAAATPPSRPPTTDQPPPA